MLRKNFFTEEDGMLSTEYVIMAGAVIVLLGVGVGLLMTSMSNYFKAWAGFFAGGG